MIKGIEATNTKVVGKLQIQWVNNYVKHTKRDGSRRRWGALQGVVDGVL